MAKCKYSARCGACVNLEKGIEWQLADKTNYIKELFADIEYDSLYNCFGDYCPFKYRNKIHLAFGELKGKTIIGFYEEGSNKITDIDSCCLFGDWAKKLIDVLRKYISRFRIRPYNKMGNGVIRYAHARCIDNKLQLTLVVVTDNFAGREWLYNKLSQQFAEVSLYLNINKRTDNAVLDKTFKFVKGNKFLNFNFCGFKVSLSPASFLQVNLSIAEKMYKEALSMLDIKEGTTVIDLYSGIGITTMMFSKFAHKVISIEEVAQAVDNAKFMMKLNNINNAICLSGKCEKEIVKLKKDEDVVVFVDPARAGLDRAVIDAIKQLCPRKIVYMSCNPETCVRDIKSLVCDNRYRTIDIKPYNMFPYTKHVEVLVSLQRLI